MANETESIGAGILGDLHLQREQILNTRDTLMEADGYVDKSLRTLKGMARRYDIFLCLRWVLIVKDAD